MLAQDQDAKQGLVSSEASLLGLQMAALLAFSLCMQISSVSFLCANLLFL